MGFIEVIIWLVFLLYLSIISLPLADKLGIGYVSKPLGLIVLTYVTWFLANFLPFHTAVLLAVLLYSIAFIPSLRMFKWRDLRKILRFEVIFSSLFLLYLVYVAFNPNIFGGEKMMDVGVLSGILRSVGMPPLDVNLAGFRFDCYYYMGYVIVAILTVISGAPIGVAYNLGLATFFSLAVSLTVEFAIEEKIRLLPFLFLSGNLASFVLLIGYLAHKVPFNRIFDFWTVTRVIPGTINEFPFATFTFRDLHPHLMDIPFQILFLILLYRYWRFEDRRIVAILALVLGFMLTVNSWEFPTYSFLLLVTLFIKRDFRSLAYLTPVLLVIPYILKLHITAVKGIGFVTRRTPLLRFVVAQPLVLVPLIYLIKDKRFYLVLGASVLLGLVTGIQILPLLLPLLLIIESRDFETPLIVTIVLMLTLVEILYVNDPYPQKWERLNTVFKTYIQAWILLSFVSAIIYERLKGVKRGYLVLLFLAILWMYPIGFLATHHSWKGTIDGMTYTDGEYNALRFLQGCPNGVVLEYPGDSPFSSYTYAGRVSAFTGLQAVYARGGHELFWRYYSKYNGMAWWKYLYKRWNDANRMFEAKELEPVLPLLKKYHVRYIFIGKLEREHYPKDSLEKFDVFKTIYHDPNVTVYEVTFLNEKSKLLSR